MPSAIANMPLQGPPPIEEAAGALNLLEQFVSCSNQMYRIFFATPPPAREKTQSGHAIGESRPFFSTAVRILAMRKAVARPLEQVL